jgi:hypothetical protein
MIRTIAAALAAAFALVSFGAYAQDAAAPKPTKKAKHAKKAHKKADKKAAAAPAAPADAKPADAPPAAK